MKFHVIAAVMALSVATAGNAAVTTYGSSTAFEAALSGVVTEGFEDSALVAGLSYVSNVGFIANGLFNDRPIKGAQETTFSFAGGTNGFGALFDLDPGGRGQGLEFTLNLTGGGTEVAGRLQFESAGFFGFTSTNRFDSVTWRGFDDANGIAETFTLDNAQFGNLAVAGVPEPATWGLMLIGFGAMGGALRRRTRSAVTFA